MLPGDVRVPFLAHDDRHELLSGLIMLPPPTRLVLVKCCVLELNDLPKFVLDAPDVVAKPDYVVSPLNEMEAIPSFNIS